MDNEAPFVWGATPWDDLSRDALLREVQRAYAALGAAHTTLAMQKAAQPTSPYWTLGIGMGARALEMVAQCLRPVAPSPEASERLYRQFFRYAVDLLFDDPDDTYRLGFGWVVCGLCGTMIGRAPDGTSYAGKPHHGIIGEQRCAGIFRPLTWDDLAKKPDDA